MKEIKLGGLYQHYKGRNYIVRDLARHSETLEWMVVYECLYENELGKMWVRPKAMFEEEVEVDGKFKPRFRYLEDQS